MIEITNLFTDCTISPRYNSKPEWIVWHYFGALSTAKECALWFCNPENNQGSADFCVDDEDIIQVNPDILRYYTWHCGGPLQGVISHSKFGICRNRNPCSRYRVFHAEHKRQIKRIPCRNRHTGRGYAFSARKTNGRA